MKKRSSLYFEKKKGCQKIKFLRNKLSPSQIVSLRNSVKEYYSKVSV